MAGRLTEFQGPICAPDLAWNPAELVRACGLRAWYFDHLPVVDASYLAHSWDAVPAPCASLREGFPAYEAGLRQRGGTISQLRRKERKLAREVGPAGFEMHAAGERPFEALLAWKSDQYHRDRRLQIFRYQWVVQLLDRIRRYRSERLAGVLSALYAGDELAAVHLGLRTGRVLHIWFPTYCRALEQYSPGLILLLRLAEEAASSGVERIDFGPGEERYKQQFKSGDTRLLVGAIDSRVGTASLRRCWRSLNQWIVGAVTGNTWRSRSTPRAGTGNGSRFVDAGAPFQASQRPGLSALAGKYPHPAINFPRSRRPSRGRRPRNIPESRH